MRTGLTRCCVEDAIRFEHDRSCPRCGGAGLDLRSPLDRGRATAALRRRPLMARLTDPVARPSPGCMVGFLVTGIVVITLVTMVAGTFLLGPLGFIVGFLGPPIGLTVVWAMNGGRLERWAERRRAGRRAVDAPVTPAEPPEPDRGVERVTIRGTVTASGQLLRSPLAGRPCVAFRLVGSDGPRAVDDAGATGFALEGREVTVEAPAATVALPADEPRAVGEPSEALRSFLRERLVDPASPALRLAEAVLVPGDAVELSATPAREVRPSGYRGSEEITVLRDGRGSPLVIRRPS